MGRSGHFIDARSARRNDCCEGISIENADVGAKKFNND